MYNGLLSSEAMARLKTEGYNELPTTGRRSALTIFLGVIKEPMFGLLVASVVVYMLIGELKESIILTFFALLSVSIAIIQEWRSEKVLDALRDLTAPRALVIRDGKPQRIAGREVTRDDLIILSEGDRVPADGRLLTRDAILTDESLLTGESMPVVKGISSNMVYAGTLIVRGSAKAIVTATGSRSEIGKIGQTLKSVETEQPRLQQQTRKIIRFFAVLGITFSAFSIFLYGLLRHSWVDGILSGIALGMALLPEEFPLVLTVFMVMGAWRISKARVLTRQAAAIETLGSATVLCTDKTGTLTQNKMSIVLLKSDRQTWQKGETYVPEEVITLLQAGMRASKQDSYDPMDIAFYQNPLNRVAEIVQISPEFHYGLQTELPMMAQIFKEGGKFKIFAKGAPETIARACGFTSDEMEKLHREAAALAAQGMRLLAIAEAEASSSDFPENADQFNYRYLGLVGFADPLRENVPAAVTECRSAGIRIIMITGDYAPTAKAIAMQAGLDDGKILTGEELKAMDESSLRQCVQDTNIFARITPDQKLKIVNALKQNGEVVAMTGDGVNDAPSLKAAHIGVAMGGRGTDVAREASSIVLLDDNFGSLVNTIALGRRIYDNLRKAMVYISAVHVPIAGLALLPLLFNKPLILTPLLIALMEMVIDPACSVVLEAEEAEKDVMKRPPRDPSSPLLSFPALAWGFTQGSVAMLILASMWFAGFGTGLPENEIRSLVFISLMVINLVLILVNRSYSPSLLLAFGRKNPFLGWGTLGIAGFFTLLLSWPPAKELLGFGPLHGHDVAFSLAAGILLLVVLELLKPLFQRWMIK